MSAAPEVVRQALDDVQLPPAARLMMWHLSKRLDVQEFREVKLSSLAHEMRLKETTTGQNLALLVERGYLDVRPIERRSRAYRLLWTRRTGRAMAA